MREEMATGMSGRRSSGGRRTATVYMVRHGRTALNAAGLLRGQLDPPLDRVGRLEAAQLAAVFVHREIEVVVASPLRRPRRRRR